MSKKLRSIALPAIAATVTTVAGFPEFAPYAAAAASGANTYSQTHNVGQSLASAGGSYVGSNIGGSVLGGTGGTVGNALNTTLGSTAANAIGPTLGSNIVGQNLGALAGNAIGSNIGGTLASSLTSPKNTASQGTQPTPFAPKQQAAQSLPLSLQSLGGLTDQQQSSNIATGGVYGGGEGPQENSYFLNLINRRLVDDSGKVGDTSGLSPIENSYLAQLGLGGMSNSKNLLQAISNWKA
jgi:hypothetical protein